MSNVKIGKTTKRGDYLEIILHDTSRVAHPVTAKVYVTGGVYLTVPENDVFPIIAHDNLSGAVNFIEQMIPDEVSVFSGCLR